MDLVSKNKLIKTFKYTSFSLLMLIALFAIIIIYKMYFVPYKQMLKDGVDNFPELLEMAKQNEPRKEPFLTSEVMPDHFLYQVFLGIQRNQNVNELLIPLMDQKDADAMYWYAIRNMGGVYKRSRSGLWLVESAQLGNPYAALYLTGKVYGCDLFIANLCDDKWSDVAEKLFKERADKGDLKARYYLAREFGSRGSEADTDHLVKVIIDSAKKGYYRPLIDFIDEYVDRYGWKSLEDKKKGLQLLMMAANNNYAPAIEKVLSMIDNDEEIKHFVNYEKLREIIYQQSFLMGLKGGTYGAFVTASENYELTKTSKTKAIMNTYDCYRFIFFDYAFVCNDLSEDEREVAMESAQLLVDKIKAPIFIDELHYSW